MAAEEYKRLGCIASGCDKQHKAKGLCQTHYRRFQRHGSAELNSGKCAHCGKAFEQKQCTAIYCSKYCKRAAWALSNHVIENCQCECRACNAAKGTKAQGQMWLMGFADTRGGGG